MYEGFLNDFPGGLAIEQFTNLFPDLNNGMATANLVFRVLDEDNSEKLGFKEFLQAIDLVGARFVHFVKLRSMSTPGPFPIHTKSFQSFLFKYKIPPYLQLKLKLCLTFKWIRTCTCIQEDF